MTPGYGVRAVGGPLEVQPFVALVCDPDGVGPPIRIDLVVVPLVGRPEAEAPVIGVALASPARPDLPLLMIPAASVQHLLSELLRHTMPTRSS